MGPTKTSENLFFRGIWGWASTLWERLQSTSGKLHTALHGYDGTNWQRIGLVWAYEDRYEEKGDFVVLVAGNNNIDSTAVPAGFVYVVQAWAMKNRDKDITMEFHVCPASGARAIDRNSLPGANVPVSCGPVPFVLKTGDYVRSHFKACTIGDRLEVQLWGYKMAIV